MPGHLIVLIDDDQDTCDAFSEWLELAGDEVVCADNSTDAETRLAGRIPVVCILDLQLGARTGLDVFRELRDRLPGFHDTVPIVLTGMHSERAERLIEAAAMKGVVVLSKPVNPDHLSAVIARTIAERR